MLFWLFLRPLFVPAVVPVRGRPFGCDGRRGLAAIQKITRADADAVARGRAGFQPDADILAAEIQRASSSRSFAGSVTGAWQVKFSQTYAAAFPSTEVTVRKNSSFAPSHC